MIFLKVKNRHRYSPWFVLIFSMLLWNCGGGGGSSSPSTPPSPAVVSLTVASSTAFVPSGKSQTLSATVTGNTNTSVTWRVVEVNGGSITTGGVYTAVTTPGTYHVVVTSSADATKSATITVTVPQFPGFTYVANTIDGTISTYTNDSSTGLLRSNGFYDVGLNMKPTALAIDPTGSFLFVAESNNHYVFTFQIQTPGNLNQAGKLIKNVTQVSSPGNPWAIAVEPSGKFVYVADNNLNGGISAFSITNSGTNTGALTAIGTPVLAGSYPDALAVDPSGKYLYVSNYGGIVGSVSAYTIDVAGGLTPIAGTFPTGVNPQAIAVDPSGKFVFVANNDGYLTSFNITGTGSLNAISNILVGSSLNSVAIYPSGDYIYLTDSVSNKIYAYSINSLTGTLTAVTGSPFTTGPTPDFVSVDSSGQFLYVANRGSHDIWEFSINLDNGSLTKTGMMRGRSGSYSMALSQKNNPVSYIPRFAYVANFFSSDVYAYSINQATGYLTTVGSSYTISAGNRPNAITVDPTGNFLYVTDINNNNVLAYFIDPITGVLTAINGSPFSTDSSPLALTTDPSGRFLYVANQSSNTITIFRMNPDGTLSTPPVSQSIGFPPQSVTIDPTGQFLYVGYISTGSVDVNVYQIDSHSGGLTIVSGSPFGAGGHPYSMAIDPTGQFGYVVDQVLPSQNVAGFSISSDSNLTSGQQGALTQLSQPTISARTTPTRITSEPTGKFLFVTNSGSGDVTTFSINPFSDILPGNLNKEGDTNPYSAGSPYDITIDISGRFAYVADSTNNNISTFSIHPLFGLANQSPISVISAGSSPQAIVTTGVVQ